MIDKTLLPCCVALALAVACGSSHRPAPAEPEPSTVPAAAAAPTPRANTPQVYLTDRALHVTAGTYRYRIDHCDGAADVEALRALLEQLAHRIDSPHVAISAAAGLTYDDLIAVLDVAISAGAHDVEVVADPGAAWLVEGDAGNPSCGRLGDLELPPAVEPVPADAHPPVIISNSPTPSPGAATKLDDLLGPGSESSAPPEPPIVVVIGNGAISIEGAVVSDAQVVDGRIPAVAQRLTGLSSQRVVVLQADRSTDIAVVHAFISSAKELGFGQIAFAVQRR